MNRGYSFVGVKITQPLWKHPLAKICYKSCEHYDQAMDQKQMYCSECGTQVEMKEHFGYNLSDQASPVSPFTFNATDHRLYYLEYPVSFFQSRTMGGEYDLDAPAICVAQCTYPPTSGHSLILTIDQLHALDKLVEHLTNDNVQFIAGVWTDAEY